MTVGLDHDHVVRRRRDGGSNGEGNPITTTSVKFDGLGTYGSPSGRDVELAGLAGAVVEGVVATDDPGAKPGDFVDVRGKEWIITQVHDVRHHWRWFLRRSE